MILKFAFVVVAVRDADRPGPHFHTEWFEALSKVVRQYWLDMSGGRVDCRFALHADVILSMSQAEKDKLSAADLISAVRAAAAGDANPFDADEHLIAIVDDPSSGGGVTSTDPIVAAVDIDAALVCHEMGHFFQHANGVDGTHADTWPFFLPLEYGDETCIMGVEGGKFSYLEPSLDLAGAPGHQEAGPAMCPPMTVRTGWLDEGNPAAVTDLTHSMPIDVQLDSWTGAPPPGHAGRPTVAIVDGHAPDADRIYLAYRSPRNRWDQAFPSLDGRPGTGMIVAYELLDNGATVQLNRCAASAGSWMRLGRAPLRVDVREGGALGPALIRVTEDPWRNWAELATPNGQPVRRVAAVARHDAIDLFVIADDGRVYTRPFRNGMWLNTWELLDGAAVTTTAGIAVASTAPDSMDLFVVGTDNDLRHHHYGPEGWHPDWPVVPGDGRLDQNSGLAAAVTGDHLTLFATAVDGRVISRRFPADPDGWQEMPWLPAAHRVAANTLADGIVQVHAVTEGANDMRLFSTVGTRGVWQGWFNHGVTPLDDRAAVASATVGTGRSYAVGAANPMFVRTFDKSHWVGGATTVDGITFGRDTSLAAVSREPRSVDVAAIDEHGKLWVISASPDPNFVPADKQTWKTYGARLTHSDIFVSALPLPLDGRRWLFNNQQVVPGPAEQFTIHELQDAGDGGGPKILVAVQSGANGKFVTAENGGGNALIARGDRVGHWEMFKMFRHPMNPNAKVFRALGGHCWRSQGDGGAMVDCRAIEPKGWEEFLVLPD